MVKNIAVLGAGHGGLAFSGHLALKGFEVRLYEDPKLEKNIEEIKAKGGIEISGAINGFGKVALASTDISSVLSGAEVIIIPVTAFAQRIMFEATLPYLKDGQIVVYCPGNFAEILSKKIMKEKGVNTDIKLCGTASLPYATHKIGISANKVEIFSEKVSMPTGCLPAIDTDRVIKVLKEVIPQVNPAKNSLEIGLMNINIVIHVAAICNAGWIEYTKGNFEFYWHGMTPSVCRVCEKVDEERIAIGRALGFELKSTLDILNEFYPSESAETYYEFVKDSRAHGGGRPGRWPTSLTANFISEEIRVGCVFISSIGKLLNVPTPTIDSIICLASVMNEIDYHKKGRSLEHLDLGGMSKEEIINYVNTGEV